jgi:hypothetical protein
MVCGELGGGPARERSVPSDASATRGGGETVPVPLVECTLTIAKACTLRLMCAAWAARMLSAGRRKSYWRVCGRRLRGRVMVGALLVWTPGAVAAGFRR